MPFEDNDALFDKIYMAMGCKDRKEFQRNEEFEKRNLKR